MNETDWTFLMIDLGFSPNSTANRLHRKQYQRAIAMEPSLLHRLRLMARDNNQIYTKRSKRRARHL